MSDCSYYRLHLNMYSALHSSCMLIIILFIFQLPRSANAQVLAPNISSCHLPIGLPSSETAFSCCAPLPPAGAPLPEIFVPDTAAVMKVRRPAHKLDAAEAARLARAYELMKALPNDDPRSFMQQANIHCAYCNTVYNQRNSTQLFQVHQSWIFFAFHRWYLFFHERILAKLLEDDTFALPFWNYDHPEGSTLPPCYLNPSSTLYDTNRHPSHSASTVISLAYNYNLDAEFAPGRQLVENANHVYRVLVRDADTQTAFFGSEYRHGDDPTPGGGTVEQIPHNTVHVWVGDPANVGAKDLGSFYAAGRDPLFYAHHAQIDRMWELWKQISDGNKDIDDPAYLDAEMEFYDENAELVRVRVGDSLNTSKLGYVYEDVELPWLSSVPVKLSDGPASLAEGDYKVCEIGSPIKEPCSIEVKRSVELARTTEASSEEYVVVQGLEWTEGLAVQVDVFLNLPSANASTTSGCYEYVGFLAVYPEFYEGASSTSKAYRLRITHLIQYLGLGSQPSLIFTFVPKGLVTGSPASLSRVYLESSPTTQTLSSPIYEETRNSIAINGKHKVYDV